MASIDYSLVIDNFKELEIAAFLLVCAGILTLARDSGDDDNIDIGFTEVFVKDTPTGSTMVSYVHCVSLLTEIDLHKDVRQAVRFPAGVDTSGDQGRYSLAARTRIRTQVGNMP